jgi:hypothetical protein
MEAPYLDTLKETLATQNKLLVLLEKRLEYLNSEIANCESPNYHTNEAQITIIKTESEILTLKKVLKEKTEYFEKFAQHFELEYADMERKYDKLMENAFLRAGKLPKLKTFLNNANKKLIETDKEAKLFFYKKVKEYIQ